MQPTFNLVEGYLKENSRMEKELCIKGISANLCESMYPRRCSCHSYDQHIKSLRSYPILPGSEWVKKEGLIEGIDFVIDKGVAIPIDEMYNDFDGADMKTQEQLCQEIRENIVRHLWSNRQLQEHYTIILK